MSNIDFDDIYLKVLEKSEKRYKDKVKSNATNKKDNAYTSVVNILKQLMIDTAVDAIEEYHNRLN